MRSVDIPLAADAPVLVARPTPPPPRRVAFGRFRRDHAAVLGVAMLALILSAVLAAPWLTPYDPTTVEPANGLEHSTWEHPLGTDLLGRDILSRILYGGRTSVLTALVATLGISALGLLFGVISGMFGGAVDALTMRLVEILQALPLVIVAMVTVGLLGGGTDKLVLTVVLLGWPVAARVVRAATLSIRERGFVEAARAHGATTSRITVRHIVPSVLSPLTALTMIELGRIILVLAALSFLGFGVRPPTPEWGAMLADARTSFFLAPRLLVYPGIAISLLVFAVNLTGDGFRDAIQGKVGQL